MSAGLDLTGLVLPNTVEEQSSSDDGRRAEYVLQPLERGFGHTVGNSIRRVLLSSLPGCAIWAFRADGVQHEHQTIPGVVEDIHQVIQKLKKLVIVLDPGVDEAKLELAVSKAGLVTAAMIGSVSGVTVINSEEPKEQGVPPYVIFHDATLMEMMEYQPRDLQQMSRISGVGENKLAAYGQAFLEVLGRFSAGAAEVQIATQTADTVDESIRLFRQGLSVAEIAALRELKASTIFSHMATAISSGLVHAPDVLAMEETEFNYLQDAVQQHAEGDRLKPVFDALGGEVDYGVLRCVRAAMQVDQGD